MPQLPVTEGTTVLLLDRDGACVASVTVERSDSLACVLKFDTEMECRIRHHATDSVTKPVTKTSESP